MVSGILYRSQVSSRLSGCGPKQGSGSYEAFATIALRGTIAGTLAIGSIQWKSEAGLKHRMSLG